jgi:cytochrome o ubiquinol oxidase subunit III
MEKKLAVDDTKIFGFWVYLMTDLLIFCVLFASFIVLRNNTYGGPSAQQLFSLSSAFAETLFLLTSSFTCSIALVMSHQKKRIPAIIWFILTFILGAGFLTLELLEFTKFVQQGASWQRSAFLSSYFTLVGTHGLHITVGLFWIVVTIFRLCLQPLISSTITKILLLGLFWHFLDFVWIFIFSVVYGMGYLL